MSITYGATSSNLAKESGSSGLVFEVYIRIHLHKCEVLMAVTMKIAVFWEVTPCCLVEVALPLLLGWDAVWVWQTSVRLHGVTAHTTAIISQYLFTSLLSSVGVFFNSFVPSATAWYHVLELQVRELVYPWKHRRGNDVTFRLPKLFDAGWTASVGAWGWHRN